MRAIGLVFFRFASPSSVLGRRDISAEFMVSGICFCCKHLLNSMVMYLTALGPKSASMSEVIPDGPGLVPFTVIQVY